MTIILYLVFGCIVIQSLINVSKRSSFNKTIITNLLIFFIGCLYYLVAPVITESRIDVINKVTTKDGFDVNIKTPKCVEYIYKRRMFDIVTIKFDGIIKDCVEN
jgi:predicted membrane channel-forming protein YqfA (hemolysin III family)